MTQTMGLKAIHYAYPSSPEAKRLGCGGSGCYYVGVAGRVDIPDRTEAGPFKTVEEAAGAADAISDRDWSPLYRARPLPGHNIET